MKKKFLGTAMLIILAVTALASCDSGRTGYPRNHGVAPDGEPPKSESAGGSSVAASGYSESKCHDFNGGGGLSWGYTRYLLGRFRSTITSTPPSEDRYELISGYQGCP